jgi:transcription initiation factor TFIID subunit TAF12
VLLQGMLARDGFGVRVLLVLREKVAEFLDGEAVGVVEAARQAHRARQDDVGLDLRVGKKNGLQKKKKKKKKSKQKNKTKKKQHQHQHQKQNQQQQQQHKTKPNPKLN